MLKGIKNKLYDVALRTMIVISIAAFFLAVLPLSSVSAAQLTSREVTISSSAPSEAGVGYVFQFTPAASTAVQSVNIDFCTTASGACDPTTASGVPGGLDTTGASLDGTPTGLGTGGTWTGSFGTNGRLRISNASSTGSASAATVSFTGITNPSADNTSFFMRITTYSDSAYTTAIDSGTVTASTASQIDITAAVDETLTFCSATSGITTSSCTGATGTNVDLGTLSASSTGTGTSQLGATTNGGSGYAITVAGNTLTSGANTIDAMDTATTSSQGTEQFGMNLVANTTPPVGSNPDGSGSASPATGYGTADNFKFTTGDTIASNGAADNFRRFTVSYIANVGNVTEPGTYSTTLTYVCTATF